MKRALTWMAVVSGGFAAGAIAVANLSLLESIGLSYFPGDGSIADLFLAAAVPVVLFCTGVAFFSRGASRRASTAAFVIFGVAVVGPAPSAYEVGRRHFGEWATLKQLLLQNEQLVLELTQNKSGQLTEEEFERARTFYSSHPVSFRFEGMPKPVQVRVMSTTKPYVGVDFGEGQNAVFDPVTMFCTYSD